MSTVIYPSPIFGPVHSRRLGLSLGINLQPSDGKVCTFDCVYCECGFNADHRPRMQRPSREEVYYALEKQLITMASRNELPDVLTFAGNGEPTTHPHFHEIISDTIRLRDNYCPQAKVSVLSNATMITKDSVREALMKVDNNILKLDTVNPDYIKKVDRPTGHYDVSQLIEAMKLFKGHIIIQTMFMKGTWQGIDVDNTGDRYVLPWLDVIRAIHPKLVTIYTIDRETPDKCLAKATHEELDRIAKLVNDAGIHTTVSY